MTELLALNLSLQPKKLVMMAIVDGNKQSVSDIASTLGFSTDEITDEILTQTVTEIIAKNDKLVKKI